MNNEMNKIIAIQFANNLKIRFAKNIWFLMEYFNEDFFQYIF